MLKPDPSCAEGGADFGPALAALAVALVFLDGEDVEVGDCRRGPVIAGRVGWVVDCDCSSKILLV